MNLEKSTSEKAGFLEKTVDRVIKSKYKSFFRNPLSWFVIGTYLPGKKQEQIANRANKNKLKYSVTSLIGCNLLNIGKITYGNYLIMNMVESSNEYIKVAKEIGATGLFLWAGIGLLETGVRTYLVAKNRKPIAGLPIEGSYNGGLSIFKKFRDN